MKTRRVVIRRKEGVWYAETVDGVLHRFLGQTPNHTTLTVGRDENRLAFADIMDSDVGPIADFKDFRYNP